MEISLLTPKDLANPHTVIDEIQSDIASIKKDASLHEEINFVRRGKAIDTIEFNVIDRIEGLFQTLNEPGSLILLKDEAERIKRQLEEIDESLFQRLRAEIRESVPAEKSLAILIKKYVGVQSKNSVPGDYAGYDSLDMFINGLLLADPLPIETKDREPGMLYYQQTPARIILEMIQKAHLTEQDVFYDLGSGLGQVAILVKMFSAAKVKGVEFEPAFCDFALECAAKFDLAHIDFINIDARQADYSNGTVFYLYTPFEGRILQEVLEKLHRESQNRTILVFTYGPCTPNVSRQNWLKCLNQDGTQLYKLGIFKSI